MSDTNEIIEKPKSITGVLGAAFRVYKQVFISVLSLAILFSVLYLLCLAMLSIPINQFIHPLAWLLLLVFPLSLFIYALLVLRIDALIKHKQCSIRELMRTLYPKYGRLLIASLIAYIVSILGYALLVIPGIFLETILAFPLFALLLENQSIMGSLKMSWHLVWGNWWRTFTITLLIPILFLITVLLVCCFFLANTLIDTSMSLSSTPIFMLSLGIVLLIPTLLCPLFISLLITQFKDLQIRQKIKEAKALAVNA